MELRIQIVGLNQFLTGVYRTETRLSTLLSDLDFEQSQIEAIRHQSLDRLVQSFIRLIREQIVTEHDGERRYQVCSRRSGFDGRRPDTLETIGKQLGISRERVRQLQMNVVARCRSRMRKRLWETGLAELATGLVGPPRAVTHAPTTPVPPIPNGGNASRRAPSSTDLSDSEIRTLSEAVKSILSVVPNGLNYRVLAHILVGHDGPLISSIVRHYNLPQHGILGSAEFRRVRRAVRVVCMAQPSFEVVHGTVKLRRLQ